MSEQLTTAFAAKAYLVALFNEALAAQKANAYFGRPNQKVPPEENIYVLNIEKGNREWKRLAAGARRPGQVEETYQIRVEVEVQIRNGEAEATEARAWELGALLEEALARDVTLGGMVQSALPTDFEAPSEGGADGWACTYSLAVAIEARV